MENAQCFMAGIVWTQRGQRIPWTVRYRNQPATMPDDLRVHPRTGSKCGRKVEVAGFDSLLGQ